MFTFSTYVFLVFVHVASAVVLIGQAIGSLLVRARIGEAQTVVVLREWFAFWRDSARWNPAAALLLLATGVYLGAQGWWSAGWFQVAAVTWVVNAVLAVRVIKPAAAALGAAVAGLADGPVPKGVLPLVRVGEAAARVMLANDVAMLYVMVGKTTLVESAAAIGLAQAVLALAAARRPVRQSAQGAAVSGPA